jgi:hypothetical protein
VNSISIRTIRVSRTISSRTIRVTARRRTLLTTAASATAVQLCTCNRADAIRRQPGVARHPPTTHHTRL